MPSNPAAKSLVALTRRGRDCRPRSMIFPFLMKTRLEDVRIVILKNPGLDIGYMRGWLSDFTLAVAEDFAARFERIAESTRRERA